MSSWRRVAAAAAVATLALGCASSAAPSARCPPKAARDAAVSALADASARLDAGRARTLHVSASVTSRGLSRRGRGVVAVRPPGDVRMILLGPSGLTALDVWISGPRDRLEVPSLEHVELDGAGRPGRPQSFLRWWLLAPLSGRVLWVDEAGRVTLRAPDGALVSVELGATRLLATRRTSVDVEHLAAELSSCGRASWRSARGGVEIEISCESSGGAAPDRAFEEPR